MEKDKNIRWHDFEKVDIRVGKIIDAKKFPKGKHSSHILQIDFGTNLGIKKSLARLVPRYGIKDVFGRNILAVVNFEPRQIGGHMSEVLVLGIPGNDGSMVLIAPDEDVPLGGKVY